MHNMADNDDLKVYRPTEIEQAPLPGQEAFSDDFYPPQGGGTVYKPKEEQQAPLPRKVIAHETVSSSLDTKSRKIMQQYKFTESGALQIGKYKEGVSGDIRITPDGLTARDKSGNTTISIDADTGDGTFKGTVQAGSIIAGDGDIVTEESSNGNGRIVFYNNGIPAIVIGDPA